MARKLSKRQRLKKEMDRLVKEYDELTTSDLQGIAMALSMEYGVSDDYILEYVYDKVI